MSLSEMDDALVTYLGDQYSAGDWEELRRLLFSGDADDAESSKNLTVLWKRYIPDSAERSPLRSPTSRMDGSLSRSRIQKSNKISKVSRIFD
jgi:hypothetical protein